MTIEEIRNSTELYLEVDDVAPLLHTKPQRLRERARTRPDLLGFPCSCLTEGRVIFPRIPFLEFFGYEEKPATNGELHTSTIDRE